MANNQVVILAGQSNALGQSTLVSSLTGAFSGYGAEVTDVRVAAQQQCNIDSGVAACAQEYPPFRCGPRYTSVGQFGPELGIARNIPNIKTHAPNGTFIVKCATGSSDLPNDWAPGAVSGRVLFPRMVDFVSDIMSPMGTYDVVGMIWVQGEADAQILAEANAYEANLAAFIAACRVEFGATMPFIISGLHTDNTATYASTVRTAEVDVAAADSLTTFVDPDAVGFVENGDGSHYGSNEICDLGDLLGAALDNLIAPCV